MIRSILLTLSFVLLAACGSSALQPRRDFSVPMGLLYGRDSLIIVPPVAEEGVNMPDSALQELSRLVRARLVPLTTRGNIPPIVEADSEFQGNPAEIHIWVTSLGSSVEEHLIRADRNFATMTVDLEFIDHETQEPLGPRVNLAAHAGPAASSSFRGLLQVAAEQIAAHIVRDLRG